MKATVVLHRNRSDYPAGDDRLKLLGVNIQNLCLVGYTLTPLPVSDGVVASCERQNYTIPLTSIRMILWQNTQNVPMTRADAALARKDLLDEEGIDAW